MTFSITIGASGTYDVKHDTGRVGHVTITNLGTGVVYWGDIPSESVNINVPLAETGDEFVDAATEAEALAVEEGMILTEGGTAWSSGTATVLKVVGKRIYLSEAAGSGDNDAVFTFTAPDIATTNGHPIQPGETVNWAAGPGGMINQRGRRIVADGTGATISITKHRN